MNRLEYLRGELRAGTMSWSELAELQSMAGEIDPGDVELLEAAGVPEFPDDEDNYIEDMFNAYVECALWSTMAAGNENDDASFSDLGKTIKDLASQTRNEMLADVQSFYEANQADLETMDAGQAGHDFWLTREHHGAGFWDRGLGELGDRLTNAAHAYGEFDLYMGDDGQVWS